MDEKKINEQLENLYCSKLPDLKKMYETLDNLNIRDYANPLLLKSHKEYLNAKKRVLFVGQETDGWCAEDDLLGTNRVLSSESVKCLQNLYLDFLLSKSYKTIFWQYIWRINQELNENQIGFMWTNVLKIGKYGSKGRPDDKVTKNELLFFDVSKEEIKILQPDVVVFLSGPDYDNDIVNHFGKFSIEESIDRCFDKIKFDSFEFDAYRTYHPAYLRRSHREEKYIEKLLSFLIS